MSLRTGRSGAPRQAVRCAPACYSPAPIMAKPRRSAPHPSTAPGGAVRTSNVVALQSPKSSQNSPKPCLKVVDTFRSEPDGSSIETDILIEIQMLKL